MPKNYTSTEIQDSVAKLVRDSIRRTYGSLGARELGNSFNDTMDAAAGVYILTPNASFYTLFLGAKRLQELLASALEEVNDLVDCIASTTRNVRPVESLTSLANARTALGALEQASAARSTAFQDIEQAPAFKRFELHSNRFLSDSAAVIRDGGSIVQTPQEARSRLADLVRSTTTTQLELKRRVTLLAGGIEEFNALNLPALLAQNIIARSRDTLQQHLDVLEALSPEERLSLLREVVLDTLTIQASVKGFGSLRPSTTFIQLDGNGLVYADSTHLASPATASSEVLDPYSILEGADALAFTVDGGPTTTVFLQRSFAARVEGTAAEPFDIFGTGNPPPSGTSVNDDLRIQVSDFSDVNVVLTKSAATAAVLTGTVDLTGLTLPGDIGTGTLVLLINGSTTPTIITYANPANPAAVVSQTTAGLGGLGTASLSTNFLRITSTLVGQGARIEVVGGTVAGVLGMFASARGSTTPRTITQIVSDINAAITTQPIVAEPYFNPERFTGIVNTINATGTTLDFVKTVGLWSDVSLQIGDLIQVVDVTSSMNLGLFTVTSILGNTASTTRIAPVVPANEVGKSVTCGPANRFLRIRITDAGKLSALNASRTIGVPAIPDNAATTLGIFPGTVVRSRRTRADEVALSVNSSSQASIGGTARVSAAAVFVGQDPVPARTEPTDPLRVVASLYRATGDITTGGTGAVFAVAGAQTAGVASGDIVTLRTAAVIGEVGVFGTITAVSNTSVSATMGSPITVTTGVELEFGPALSPARDTVLRLGEESVNAGDYRTTDPQLNPTEMVLDRALPAFFDVGNQPILLQAVLGGFRVDFASTNLTTASALVVAGTAASKFFTAPPKSVVGSTTFVRLPEDPRTIEVGDILELNQTSYSSPTFSRAILELELSALLIELAEAIPSNLGTLNFSLDSAVPFARIRKVNRNNYESFRANLLEWLDLEANEENYAAELNRLLNPIIVNKNPTISAANTAKIQAQAMAVAIEELSDIIDAYQVAVEPRVDTLISTFLDRGSDRAVDTLLEGRFKEFFGYNSEEVSYIGNALERLREVSRQDLPVRRTSRKEVADQELVLGEFEEPDFEFDQSDTQDVEEVDIPGQFIEIPGGNF